MIVLDTSVLIDALTAARPLEDALDRVLDSGERVLLPTPVLYEWHRGPRKSRELELQQFLFPDERTIVFGPRRSPRGPPTCTESSHARGGGKRTSPSPPAPSPRRGRLWTVNEQDFADIPGLPLFHLAWQLAFEPERNAPRPA